MGILDWFRTRKVDYSALPAGKALLDATSALFACQDENLELVRTPIKFNAPRDANFVRLLTMLEWAVLYDLEVHSLALKSLEVSPKRLSDAFGGLVGIAEVPTDALESASDRVEAIRVHVNGQRGYKNTTYYSLGSQHVDDNVEAKGGELMKRWPVPREEQRVDITNDHGSSISGDMEKCYFDGFSKQNVRTYVARSNDDVERALFYAELARGLGIPILLSPGKQAWLQEVSRRAMVQLHQHISQMVDDAAKRDWQRRFPDTDPTAYGIDAPLPPLGEKIAKLAESQKISLVDAATQVRESDGARAYRGLLNQLYQCARRGRDGQRELSSVLSAIRDAFSKWYTGEDKATVPVKLNLSKIPVIGFIFEIVDFGSIGLQVPKLMHEEPMYLSFIFDWYRGQRP